MLSNPLRWEEASTASCLTSLRNMCSCVFLDQELSGLTCLFYLLLDRSILSKDITVPFYLRTVLSPFAALLHGGFATAIVMKDDGEYIHCFFGSAFQIFPICFFVL